MIIFCPLRLCPHYLSIYPRLYLSLCNEDDDTSCLQWTMLRFKQQHANIFFGNFQLGPIELRQMSWSTLLRFAKASKSSITLPSSCISGLLPPLRDSTITSRLRTPSLYPRPATRTKRCTSFIHHALLNYQ